MRHESGFGISFGGGGSNSSFKDENTINIPLSINNQQACFKKKSKFTLKAENAQDLDKGSITITPMKTDFENSPEPSVKQYLFVEKSDNKLETKFHTMSFVCSGEIPLSIEATSDSYLKIFSQSNSVNVQVRNVFATGVAAENLNRGRYPLSSQETFDFFAKVYKEKTKREIDGPDCCTQKVPSVISDTSIKSLSAIERAVTSNFTTMGAKVPNGCSKDFSESMKQYLLENYERNDSLKDYKVKKKWFSEDLSFEWKN